MPVKRIREQSLITEFIIERAAIGFTNTAIAEDCKAFLDLETTLDEIKEIVQEKDIEIQQRKQKLKEEAIIKAPSIISSLNEVVTEIRGLLTAAKKTKDYSTYVPLLNSYLRSLELRGKALGEIIETQVTVTQSDQQNIDWLEYLEKKGILKINDKEQLKAKLIITR